MPTTDNTDTDAGKGVSSLFGVYTTPSHGGWYSTTVRWGYTSRQMTSLLNMSEVHVCGCEPWALLR